MRVSEGVVGWAKRGWNKEEKKERRRGGKQKKKLGRNYFGAENFYCTFEFLLYFHLIIVTCCLSPTHFIRLPYSLPIPLHPFSFRFLATFPYGLASSRPCLPNWWRVSSALTM